MYTYHAFTLEASTCISILISVQVAYFGCATASRADASQYSSGLFQIIRCCVSLYVNKQRSRIFNFY